ETPVVTGFQGITADGAVATLGRGGSDTTAVALAAALLADECRIYTDVEGIYTTDPRVCKQARLLSAITFEEMLEMASLGSKVLQTRAVEFAGKYRVPLRVLSSLTDGGGTLIHYKEQEIMEQPIVTGVAFNRDEAKITVVGVPDKPGIARDILAAVARHHINVDMIVQNIGSDERTDFSFTVERSDYDAALAAMRQTAAVIGASRVAGDDAIGKVSVVGIGMKSHAGVAATMFDTLAAAGINIQMISTSEIKISTVIDENHLTEAVQALHAAFGLDREPKQE
ncbi:MAG: aspartate kinase, partial [Gammaproteobacteria bacterium]